MEKIPVILDTDIGSDVDDTWALVHLLNSPELELTMVLVTGGDTRYRGAVAAKVLTIAGRTDVPVALGHRGEANCQFQEPWLGDFTLDSYLGLVYENGIGAAMNQLRRVPNTTIISIGTAASIAAIAEQAPDCVPQTKIVGMYGSLRLGYGGNPPATLESNVRYGVPFFRTMIQAPWKDILLTPLDTCDFAVLQGVNYQKVLASSAPLARSVLENYRIWAGLVNWMEVSQQDLEEKSSTLFDTVAVYLAYDESAVEVETLNIWATDEGLMVEDPAGPQVRLATRWLKLDWFLKHLTERITA